MRRVLFLGQKPIGEQCFVHLLNQNSKKIKVLGVVSNSSTKVWWKTNKIYQLAKIKSLSFIANEKRNEEQIQEFIISRKINIIISVQHPWIISNKILSLVNYFAFNLHQAKLPKYKGYNAFNHAILNNNKTFTVTIHWIKEKVDEGEIAFEKNFLITRDETAYSLYNKACIYSFQLFKQFLVDLKSDRIIPKTPMRGRGHFYPKNSLNPLREIKNFNDLTEVDKKSRAFYFPLFEPAYIKVKNNKFYILPQSIYNR